MYEAFFKTKITIIKAHLLLFGEKRTIHGTKAGSDNFFKVCVYV